VSKKHEFRKILIVGYAYDAPTGAKMVHANGMPMRPVECPIRFRIAFWVPQPEPFQRRAVGTFDEYLRHVVKQRRAACGVATLLDDSAAKVSTAEYMRRHQLDDHLMQTTEQLHAFTMVAAATPQELQALRDGVLEEQVQDFTFPRQPSLEQMRSLLMPHWEQRVNAALGHVPNQAPIDLKPKPTLIYTPVQ
jgi:hypothetical protein